MIDERKYENVIRLVEEDPAASKDPRFTVYSAMAHLALSGFEPLAFAEKVLDAQTVLKPEYAKLVPNCNMEVVREVADRVIVLHHGRKLAEGTPEEIFNHNGVHDAYFGTRGRHAP